MLTRVNINVTWGIKSKIIFISINLVSNVIDVILNLIDLKMLKDQGYYNL